MLFTALVVVVVEVVVVLVVVMTLPTSAFSLTTLEMVLRPPGVRLFRSPSLL